MRPTIVLLSTPTTQRELVTRLRRLGLCEEGELFSRLELDGCLFGIDFSGGVLVEYDEEEMLEISQHLDEVEAILLEYSGVSCVRQLLETVLDGLQGVLDTNFGELLRYDEVLEKFRQNPDWDWTSSSV